MDKQERENLKNLGVETREKGKLLEALVMLQKVESLDEQNSNFSGQIDVLGHIKICYSRLAEETTTSNEKSKYLELALESVNKSFEIAKTHPEITTPGRLAILNVHLASAYMDYSQNLTEKDKVWNLQKALELINDAIAKLPGSVAHKAWPSNTKAKILYSLGRTHEAIETLTYAENLIFQGYDEEITRDDQGEIKINTWLSGLHLTLANICKKEKKNILAKHYATAVLNINDPKGTLGERKKEAQRILDSIKA